MFYIKNPNTGRFIKVGGKVYERLTKQDRAKQDRAKQDRAKQDRAKQDSEVFQIGSGYNLLLLDGVSSSGKTTIGKVFQTHGYILISGDAYKKQAKLNIYAGYKNEYVTKKQRDLLFTTEPRRLMSEDALIQINKSNVIIDDIDQTILDFIPRNHITIIVIYAGLDELVRNLDQRKLTDPRGIFVFKQYAEKFHKVTNKSQMIDTINLNLFIRLLKDYLKYEFESEDELVGFAKSIFEQLGCDSDELSNDQMIGLRPKYHVDILIKTRGLTPEQIYEQIFQKVTRI